MEDSQAYFPVRSLSRTRHTVRAVVSPAVTPPPGKSTCHRELRVKTSLDTNLTQVNNSFYVKIILLERTCTY